MSASFVSSAKLPIQNGVGTVGYTVFDADGEEIGARSTVGVVRIFQGNGHGIYQVLISVGSGVTAGIVVWDDADGHAEDRPYFIGAANSGDVSVGDYDSALDSEWGGSTADSYISLVEAEDLVASYVLDKFDWDDAAGQTKDAACRMATRQLDSLIFLGARENYTQSLKFPRCFYFQTGIDRSVDQIKLDIQTATAIQAAYLVGKGGRDQHAEAMAAGIRQSSESVGPIRDQFTYAGGGAPTPLCTDAVRIIAMYRDSKKIYRA